MWSCVPDPVAAPATLLPARTASPDVQSDPADAAPVALVTGAGGGIGAAIALTFAERGWHVYATDVETPLPARVRERCDTRALDVTDEAACESVVEAVVDEAGRLDCLVNNAGYAAAGPVEDVPVTESRAQFDVLVHGPHALARAALPALRESGGRIVTVSSVLGFSAAPGAGVYAAAKAATESLHDALRIELRGTDVAVSLVEPAWVDTDFGDSARASLRDRSRTAVYGWVYDALEDGWMLDGNPLATDPERVAATVYAAAAAERSRARYPVGGFASLVRWGRALPAAVVDRIHAGYARASTVLGRVARALGRDR